MKKKIILVIVIVAAIATAWLLLRDNSNSTRASTEMDAVTVKKHKKMLVARSGGAKTLARKAIDEAVDKITSGNRQARPHIRISSDVEATWIDEDGKPWPEDQRALMRAVVDAAEEGDVAAVAAFAKQVAECSNSDLREQYIDELGWFGEQALADLVPFIADPNEDVAEAARTQLTSAFQDIESDAQKAATYILMARVVTDSDVLESVSDELFAMDEVIALQAIIDTLDAGTPKAQEAAKEAYKMITDEDWTDIDAAEAWLSENYVADDDDEPVAKPKPAEMEEVIDVKPAENGTIQEEDEVESSDA